MKFTEKYDILSTTIDINDFCNMKCVYCWEQQSKNRLDVKTAKIICKRLVENWKRHKKQPAIRVHFFGGEPLIDWNIMRYMIKAISSEVPSWFGVTTNATLLTDGIIDEFKDYNMHVMISIDGKKERHDANRKYVNGNPTYDQVVKALKGLQEQGIDYEARMTVLPENAKYLTEDVTHLVEDLGVKQIAPVPIYDRPWTEEQLNEFGNAIKNLYDLYIKYHFDYKHKVYIKFFEDYLYKDLDVNHKMIPCGFGTMNSISIDTEGNIYPCHQLPTREYREKFIVGNMITDEIVENNLVQALAPNTFHSDLCPSCPAKAKICSGGCPMESYEESGDLLSPTCSTCRFSKLYYDVIKQIQDERKIPTPVSPSERRDFLYSAIMRMVGNMREIIDDNKGKEYSTETIDLLSNAMWMINEQLLKNKDIKLDTMDLVSEVKQIAQDLRVEVVDKNG